jgi:hypothetical protein
VVATAPVQIESWMRRRGRRESRGGRWSEGVGDVGGCGSNGWRLWTRSVGSMRGDGERAVLLGGRLGRSCG